MNLITCGTSHLSFNEFTDWLRAKASPPSIVYAVGEIGRAKFLSSRKHSKVNGSELTVVAAAALSASDRREICLTQRRLGQNCFEYIATKRDVDKLKTAAS